MNNQSVVDAGGYKQSRHRYNQVDDSAKFRCQQWVNKNTGQCKQINLITTIIIIILIIIIITLLLSLLLLLLLLLLL